VPRKRQPIAKFPNVPYGRGKELTDLQKDGPPLDNGGAPADMPGGRATDQQQLVDMARRFAGPLDAPLSAPSGRPGESVMTGVAAGPGLGPEALTSQVPSKRIIYANILDEVASTSNDPRVRALAMRARARAGR